MAPVSTRVANHHHWLEVMRLSSQLCLHVGLGCRGVSSVLRLLAGYLPPGGPVATTVQHITGTDASLTNPKISSLTAWSCVEGTAKPGTNQLCAH
jgi:hypothetical protein